jgi:D-3-phosphoglycerate dehydrogenase
MPAKNQFPGHPRVVVAEPFAEIGLALLRENGVEPDLCIGQSRERLLERLQGADGLIVRSETKVDGDLLRGARDLSVVARAGVGVDAIDVEAATSAGIVVVNTPGANTLAATEQTFALMLAAMRNLPFAHAAVHAGKWDRKPFIGRELYGKTLGIIGLGRIGTAVAARAAAFGMNVIACDPYVAAARARAVGVELLSQDELLERANVVTLHVPLTPQTRGMIDADALAKMREGALLVNCSRGAVVDVDALLATLETGKLLGAALDVVPQEPPPEGSASKAVLAHPKVVATPHLGGSTIEALERIALELARDVVNVLAGRPASGAVNAPRQEGGDAKRANAFADLAFRMGRMMPQLFAGSVGGELALALNGDVAELDAEPFVAALLAGALPLITDRRISIVNAVGVAAELGVNVTVQRDAAAETASLALASREHRIVGTAGAAGARIIAIDAYALDAPPTGTMLLTRHRDVPGMVGKIGTILGAANVNISTMQVSLAQPGEEAMMVLDVDRMPERDVLAAIAGVAGISAVHSAEL